MDWGNMHAEVLELILSNVFGEDRDNFSLVCASWNKVRACSLRSKSPCLVLANRDSHSWRVYQHNSFFSLDFPVPDKDATIRCSKHGWSLMSRDDDTLFFFDFFNNRKIEVPNTPPNGCTSISFFHPPTSSKCFIIGVDGVRGCPVTIGILRHGEDTWKVGEIRLPKHLKFESSLALPVLYYKKLYFSDLKGNLATVDIEAIDMNEDQIDEHGAVFSKCHKQRGSQRNIKEQFLVKPEGEDTVFAVFVMHADREVKVFKLSEDTTVWERIHDLGNKVFYVSNASSFGYTTNNTRMANKIFFPKFHDDKIVFYSLRTQKYQSFDGKYSSRNSNGLKKYELAAWITPAPIPQFPRELLTWCSEGDDIVS